MIKSYRVEVLDDRVHRYSSTAISGGGGTASRPNPVTSTVQHHVEQEIWVRSILDAREFQIDLTQVQLPVRAGHVLTLVWDETSKRWERIVNESTGQETNAGGEFNERTTAPLIEEARSAWLFAVGLSIPLLNMLIGLVALVRLARSPVTYCDVKLKKAGRNILAALLSGVLVFLSSYWVAAELFSSSFRSFLGVLSSLIFFIPAFVWYVRSSAANYRAAVALIHERASMLDEELRRFRAEHSTSVELIGFGSTRHIRGR